MEIIKNETLKLRTKRTFLKKGTCSRTFFYILNREYGHPNNDVEIAIDPLAGGILQQGYQCGMLWGASMAVGAESFRRYKNQGQATSAAIIATQHLLGSFKTRAKSIECGDISNCDFNGKYGLLKFLITGKPITCFKLAGKWAPEAISAANDGLSGNEPMSENSISCASEVVRKMGGSDEEMSMVAGFAGGLGLSGNGCGALAAAIWMTVLKIVRNGDWKYTFDDPVTENVLNKFFETTGYKMECSKITGKSFASIEEHTEFIKNGGCDKLLNALSVSLES